MSKSIKQLRENLTVLETNTIILAKELEDNYSKYLEMLGESIKKTLILAVYQICTQKYPNLFLKLSFDERHNLQEKFKNSHLLFNEYLADYLLNIDSNLVAMINNFRQVLLKDDSTEEENQELNSPDEIENDDVSTETKDTLEENNNNEKEKITPMDLIELSLEIEYSIQETLKNVSNLTNRYLQKCHILPNQLPPKILEMALQSEQGASMISNSPNLLNLLIEKENNENDEEDRDITSITAIALQLMQIEFSDPNLSSYRHKIKAIFTKIENLKEKYLQTEHEYAIAQAESAWRSSWFDNT